MLPIYIADLHPPNDNTEIQMTADIKQIGEMIDHAAFLHRLCSNIADESYITARMAWFISTNSLQ